MTFATAVHISFTSFVYPTNVYLSFIHGIKRKPHLLVVLNWYHFVAIANLHQSRPTDSADITTRLQLSDTSSIPPMHGGFLLLFLLKCTRLLFPQLSIISALIPIIIKVVTVPAGIDGCGDDRAIWSHTCNMMVTFTLSLWVCWAQALLAVMRILLPEASISGRDK